jgi:RES domain-containing protein
VQAIALEWARAARLVSTRFPPVALFARLAPEIADVALSLEARFDPALRSHAAAFARIPAADRVTGVGAEWVMPTFVFLDPRGARFSDETVGAFYAASDVETAVAEVWFHRERVLRAERTPPMRLEYRVLRARVSMGPARCDDPRGLPAAGDALAARLLDPDPERYGGPEVPQAWARARRAAGIDGVVYPSVRRAVDGGECVAAYRPRCVVTCAEGGLLLYDWDGDRVVRAYEVRELPGGP